VELMAVRFNNIYHYLTPTEGYSNNLRDVSPMTITAWINPSTWGSSSEGRIVAKENTTGYGWGWFLNNNAATAALEFYRYRETTNTQVRSVDSVITLNVWQHVAVSYSSTATVLFLNGVALSTAINTAGDGSLRSDALDYLTLGNRQDLDRAFNGYMEDVRFYGRAMDEGEIAGIHASHGDDGIMQGILARWTCKQNYPGATLSVGSYVVKDSVNNADSYWGDSESTWAEGVTLAGG